MVSSVQQSTPARKRNLALALPDIEDRSLAEFNRLIAKAAPRAARETAAALNRFRRGIAAEIRRAR